MSKKIKILLVVSSVELGGGERMVLTLASGLSDLGIHVEVAGPQTGKLQWAFKQVCRAYHPFHFYPTKIPEFARFVASCKFDVVHTHLFGADLFGLLAARRSGVPCVVSTIHGPTYICDLSLRHRIQSYLYRMAYLPAHALIYVSEWVKQDFFTRTGLKLSLSPHRHIRVIHNCLPIMLETSECYVIPPYPGPTVLSVGEFHPIKDQMLLAKAALKVLSKMPGVRFLMIGKETEELKKINKLVSDEGKRNSFIFPGQVTVGMDTYRSATVTVMPSLYEGFGLVAFESMSAGTPTIVSTGGALTEMVGDAACTFPVGDVDECAKSILQVLSDRTLYNRLKILGTMRVKLFSRDLFIKSYLDLYYQVLNSSNT